MTEKLKDDLMTKAVMDLAKFMKTECLVEIQVGDVRLVRSYHEAIYRDQVAKASELTAGKTAPSDDDLLMDPMAGLNMTGGATNV